MTVDVQGGDRYTVLRSYYYHYLSTGMYRCLGLEILTDRLSLVNSASKFRSCTAADPCQLIMKVGLGFIVLCIRNTEYEAIGWLLSIDLVFLSDHLGLGRLHDEL